MATKITEAQRKKRRPAAPKNGSELVVVIPDIHFPHEDKRALAVAKRVIATVKPNRTVILGDMLDGFPFSTHAPKSIKEIREYSFLEEEVIPGKAFLDFVQKNTTKETVFIEGNHCNRIERWAASNGHTGQALYESISPQVQLSQGRGSNFKYISYIPHSDIGISYYNITSKLIAIHGWSFAQNAAKVHLDKAHSKSVVFGHCHRMISESRRDPFTGERLVAWSPGCLCTLSPTYRAHSPSSWVHGLSLIYVGKSRRSWTEYNLVINKGNVILPDGTELNGD